MLNVLTRNVTNVQGNMVLFQEPRSSNKNLERQLSQIVGAITKLKAKDSVRLPSQTELNPKINVSAITLRSGTKIASKDKLVVRDKEIEEKMIVHEPTSDSKSFPP